MPARRESTLDAIFSLRHPPPASKITLQSSKFNRSLATEGFAGGRPGGKQSTRNQDADVDGEMMEVRNTGLGRMVMV